MNYYLVKSEPGEYSWSQLVKDKKAEWTGVRGFMAMRNLRAMKKGDLALYYHTGKEKQIVGIARVAQEHYADPTAEEGPWVAVMLEPVKPVTRPVTLAEAKADSVLKDSPLAWEPRQSVQRFTEEEYQRALKLAGTDS